VERSLGGALRRCRNSGNRRGFADAQARADESPHACSGIPPFFSHGVRATTASDGRAGRVLLPGSWPRGVHRRGATSASRRPTRPCVPNIGPLPTFSRRAPQRSRAPPRSSLRSRLGSAVTISPLSCPAFPRACFQCERGFPLGSSARSPESARLRTSRPLRGATPLLSRFPLKGIPSGNAGRASEERPGARSSANEPTEKAALTKETIP
jgi:hypothetical protein